MLKISVVIRAIERNLSTTGFDSTSIYFDLLDNDFIFLFNKIYKSQFESSQNIDNDFPNYNDRTRYIPFNSNIDCSIIIHNYILTITDSIIIKHLQETLLEKNGICKFKDALRALNLMDDYQKYKYNMFKNVAINWCKENKIEFEDVMYE